MTVERATLLEGRARLPVHDLLERDIQAALARAKKRLLEGEEHGGKRQTLCLLEARAAMATAQKLRGILKTIEERGR